MAIPLTSPVTGAAQTGFTSPTYTIVADVAPSQNGKQFAVTALGGTQAGVTPHTATSPFTITFVRPQQIKMLPPIGNNGQYGNVPVNVYKLIGRKGVTPAVGQPDRIASATLVIEVPAGSETYDPAEIRGLLSALLGAANQVAAGIGDTVITNVM